jgi:hypothetical protein
MKEDAAYWRITTIASIKLNFTKEQAMRSERRSRGIILLFL